MKLTKIVKGLSGIEGQSLFVVLINGQEQEVAGTCYNAIDAKMSVKAFGDHELALLKARVDETWVDIDVELSNDRSTYTIYTTDLGRVFNGVKTKYMEVTFDEVPILVGDNKKEPVDEESDGEESEEGDTEVPEDEV